jgi:hypothetical protein
MNIRTLRLGAAALATVALAACNKAESTPAVVDTTAPAAAPATVMPVDSSATIDTTAPAVVDSAKPATDSATPKK